MPRPIAPPPPSLGLGRDFLALNLVRLRRVRGWSQEDLAYEAGLHRTFVGHVERRVRNISLDNIERLAYALGVPLDELLRPPEAPLGATAKSAEDEIPPT